MLLYLSSFFSSQPTAISNPVDQFKKTPNNANVIGIPASNSGKRSQQPAFPMPEVMKKDTGGYFAKIEINDLPARYGLIAGCRLQHRYIFGLSSSQLIFYLFICRPFLTKHSTHELVSIMQHTICNPCVILKLSFVLSLSNHRNPNISLDMLFLSSLLSKWPNSWLFGQEGDTII